MGSSNPSLGNPSQGRPAEYLNDDAKQLATVVGGLALGAYVLMHPRVIKFALAFGAAEFVRRHVSLPVTIPALRSDKGQQGEYIRSRAVITIACEPGAVYRYWRDLNNAPLYMSGVEEVRVVSEKVAIWKMCPIQGKGFSWVGETTEDIPDKKIGWQIIGSDVMSGSGGVQFRSGLKPGTTEVQLHQEVQFPVTITIGLSQMLMRRQLQETLRRLKQILETGEVARIAGQPSGERSLAGRIARDYVKPVLIPS
jgi:uncharacterized membrane protein